jgi:hypothetical protein
MLQAVPGPSRTINVFYVYQGFLERAHFLIFILQTFR